MKSGVMVIRNSETKEIIDLEGDFHLDTDQIMGGWACVYFKTREHPMLKRLRLGRFNTGRSQWLKDPAGMICKCAEADALRSAFPTMLGGLYLREEMEREAGKEEVKTPIFKQKKLNVVETALRQEMQQAYDAEPAPEQETPLQYVKAMCAEDGIAEDKLLASLKSIGVADDEDMTLAEVDEEQMEKVADNWADISRRMKEVAK